MTRQLCAERGIELSTVQQLHDALGFAPPAASDHVRDDDLVVIETGPVRPGCQQRQAIRIRRPPVL
jgi:hypothetical protein